MLILAQSGPEQSMLSIDKANVLRHHEPKTLSDRTASGVARTMGAIASALFKSHSGDRAVVLETVAAVPAMVAATLLHLRCLRRMMDDRGWVRTFMGEAENQRAHLMAFVAITRPSFMGRLQIVVAQGVFYNAYFLLSLVSTRTAHRLAGYLAEHAVRGYSDYLARLESGAVENRAAPSVALQYWNLAPEARLSEMVRAIREDEAIHRDIHHAFATALASGHDFPERSSPLI
jgi:ubiquinol oxidase